MAIGKQHSVIEFPGIQVRYKRGSKQASLSLQGVKTSLDTDVIDEEEFELANELQAFASSASQDLKHASSKNKKV